MEKRRKNGGTKEHSKIKMGRTQTSLGLIPGQPGLRKGQDGEGEATQN